jgi:hypothetical protein
MGFKNKGEKMCKTCTHSINRGQKKITPLVYFATLGLQVISFQIVFIGENKKIFTTSQPW